MAVFDPHFGGYRIFVGDLGRQATRYDIEREYERYGRLIDVWVARNPPGFAFIVFKNLDECERAVRKSHGRRLCGRRVRVEYARPFDDRSGKQQPPTQSRHRSRSPRRYYSRTRDSSGSRSPRRRSRSRDRRRRTPRRSKSRSENKAPSRFCRERNHESEERQDRSSSSSPIHIGSKSPLSAQEKQPVTPSSSASCSGKEEADGDGDK